MNPKVAQNIIAFLNRVQIQGSEVPAFVEAFQVLSAFVNPPLVTELENKDTRNLSTRYDKGEGS